MEKYTLVKEGDFEKARKKIKSLKKENKKIAFTGDDELNRKILEKEKIDVLLLDQSSKKDFAKQRNSGLNHVLARIAKKNNVAIGINLNEILMSSGIDKARIIGRIIQNIKLCNKSKLKMIFFGEERDEYDLKALGLVLGMSTKMIKHTFYAKLFK